MLAALCGAALAACGGGSSTSTSSSNLVADEERIDGGEAPDAEPDADPCELLATDLDELIAAIAELDDSVTQAWLDAVEQELAELDAIDDAVLADLCPEAWLEIGDALEDLSNLPLDEDLDGDLLEDILDLQSDAWEQLDHVTDLLDGGGTTTTPSFEYSCAVWDWDRLQPYDQTGLPDFTGCDVLARTQRAGVWYHQGDPAAVTPSSFGTWERWTDDYGRPLYATSDMLSPMDGIDDPYADVDVMASAGSYQFSSTLKLEGIKPAIAAAGTVFIVYGRTNSTSTHVLTPKMFVDDGVILEYEYGPKRDSVKILGCPASELLPWEELSFGNRQSYDAPWIPFVPVQPAMWAVVAVCPPQPPPPDAPPVDANDGDAAVDAGVDADADAADDADADDDADDGDGGVDADDGDGGTDEAPFDGGLVHRDAAVFGM